MRVSAFLVSAARAFYVNDDIEEFKSILENLDGDHADVLTDQADNLYDKLVSAQNAVDFEMLFSKSKALAFKEIINQSLEANYEVFRNEKGVNVGIKDADKLSGYGCYCLPTDLQLGHFLHGSPVDPIDSLCKRLHNCYKCATITYPTCTFTKPYRIDNGQCVSPLKTCKGDLCQCDMDFAIELQKVQHHWSEEFSLENGFDREARCQKRTLKRTDQQHEKNGPGRSTNNLNCCNRGLDAKIFNPEVFDCCPDGNVAPAGTCAEGGFVKVIGLPWSVFL